MRVMVSLKPASNPKAGVLPSTGIISAMTKYNEELVSAGVMLAGEGLQPSSKGARVKFEGSERIVMDGRFAETKELIAGFWIWRVKSMSDRVSQREA